MARILIADDDKAYRAAFSAAMETLGHGVIGVSSGDEVLPALADHAIDILFLDVLMEGGGAASTLHAVHAAQPLLPIVILTGHAELARSPLFREGMRSAAARFHKTDPLARLDEAVRRLTR